VKSTPSSTPSKPSTASAIATTRAERARRGLRRTPALRLWRLLWRSPISRIIFLANLLGLAVLALGVLVLSQLRAGLMEAKLDGLESQGELIANVLAEAATIGEPAPGMDRNAARLVLSRMRVPPDTRVRLFDRDGRLVADSYLLIDQVTERKLPDIGPALSVADAIDRLVQQARAVVRGEPVAPPLTLTEELTRAGAGEVVKAERRSDAGARVASVSVPIQRVKAVLGVLTLESSEVDQILRAERLAQLPFIGVALLVTLLSSAVLAVLIARPLRRLATAAHRVRLGATLRLEAPELAARSDEIGDLAKALESMTDALADRIESNERFAADVAHELKNPLNSIRSAAETMPVVQDEAKRRKLLGVITQDVKRLDRLITDISNAARLEAQLARSTPERVDLTRLLAELAETYNLTTPDSAPRVVFTSDGADVAIVRGRETPLGQVFRNLVDNALTFSPPGGDVHISLTRAHGRVTALVDDDGPGVPPDKVEKIFDRFYTDRPHGAAFGRNSGLGLSIAKAIVEAHRGRIWADNRCDPETGRRLGARFGVELPEARI
jgi:two-component system sensor histidine kinase ChvG